MKITRLVLGSLVCLAVLSALARTSFAEAGADDALVDMVFTLLSDADKDMRALGLEQVRTAAKGPAATQQFAALLPKLSRDAQVGLLGALAERGDTAARPAVLDMLATSQDERVKLAAIAALGFLGESADAHVLMQLMEEGAPNGQAEARKSLVRLSGESVARVIATEMNQAAPPLRVMLLEILAARRAVDTIPDMLTAALAADSSVRAAAMVALGQLAGPEHVPGLVQGVLKAEPGREREAAEKAVMLVCSRIAAGEQRAEPLLAAMDTLSKSDRTAMLPTLGRVGGPAALKSLEAAISHADPELHDAGVRAMCNWPDSSIVSRLTELAQQDEHAEHRTKALRALIRIASLPDGRADTERLELLRTTMHVCTRDTERNLVLQRASAIRIPETLRFLVPYLDQPTHAQQACQSVVELAHHRGLREANKSEFAQALDKVLQVSKDAEVVDRATRYKNNQTWVRPRKPNQADQ